MIGLFGFIPYNDADLPDLAGSIWKVDERAKSPMLGLRLRDYVVRNVPHRYFAASGAGLQTRPIYRTLNMEWVRMRQYYLLHPDRTSFDLAVMGSAVETRPGRGDSAFPDSSVEMRRVSSAAELRAFPFDPRSPTAPLKDWAYVKRRFFEHPIYTYDVYLVHRHGAAVNILVCREVRHGAASAYRMVDFYGEELCWNEIAGHLRQHVVRQGHEYVDFLCYGFDDASHRRAGFLELDLDQQDRIIPHYFEPFERRNVPVYAVADRSDSLRLRLCKADGDQDRPNR